MSALFHLRQDRVLEFLLGRLGLGFLALRLVQRCRRQHRLEALGALSGLGGVRLVHDQPEALAGELADLLGDDGEFLERGDDDGLARLQRVLELARGGVDVLHHPQGLLELPHRGLELAVEHPAVGDDHDGVEDPAVICVVQRGKLVGQPGDGEALAAPGRVLDEVALSRPQGTGVRHEPAHAVELLIARKDEEPFTSLAPLLVFLLNLMDDLAHQVQDAVPRPGLFPEIAGRVAGLRRRHGRVPCAAELAPVEGEKPRLGAGQMGGDVDHVRVHGEVRKASAIGQQRLAPRVAIVPVLADGILDGLAAQRVLELGREQRNAVQKQHQIEALLVLGAVSDLTGDREEVRRVKPPGLLVEPARRPEEGKPERTAHVLHAGPQDAQRAAVFDLGGQAFEKPLLHPRAVVLRQLLPFLRLRRQNEVHDVARQEAKLPVVVLGAPPVIAAGLHPWIVEGRGFLGDAGRLARDLVRPVAQQGGLDGLLEGAFGDDGVHEAVSGSSPASGRTSILPVTAAEMRAVRSSLRRSMASWTLATRALILAVSRSRKAAMALCSSDGGKGKR